MGLVIRKQQEWLEIPSRSRMRRTWQGSPVRVYRDGNLLSFVTRKDQDYSRINTFNADDLRAALDAFDGLPPAPDGELG